jgi:hypothetical protein
VIGQKLRSIVIAGTARAMNWVSDHIVCDSLETTWVDHLRWFLEDRLSWVFGLAYFGSDEELAAVWNFEIPLKYMSERQRQLLPNDLSLAAVECCACRWEGALNETEDDECPCCGHAVDLRGLYVTEPVLALPERSSL